MRVALTVWNGRVSPVFDVARTVLVLDVQDGAVVGRREEALDEGAPALKARGLAGMGVATLICGATSRPAVGMLSSYGITTVPFVAGDVEEVIAAYLKGEIHGPKFAMPGCCGRRQRFRGGRRC